MSIDLTPVLAPLVAPLVAPLLPPLPHSKLSEIRT